MTDILGAGKPIDEQGAAKAAAAEKAAAEKAAAERAAEEKAAAAKAAAAKAAAAQKADAERVAAEEAAEERVKSRARMRTFSNILAEDLDSDDYLNMNDTDRARLLLIVVSKKLFGALLIVLAASAVVFVLMYFFAVNAYATIPIVMLCGIIGGFIGIQRRLKELTLADLELLAISKVYLVLSPVVGGVLAFFLYILFLSDLISGPLFPGFGAQDAAAAGDAAALPPPVDIGFFSVVHQQAAGGAAGYAKLMFWCFVAGFSEKFVTNIIGKFEGNAVKDIGKPASQ